MEEKKMNKVKIAAISIAIVALLCSVVATGVLFAPRFLENSSVGDLSKIAADASDYDENNNERPERVTSVFSFKIENAIADFKKQTFYDSQNGNVLPYCIYIPDDYSPSKAYPVVLYLHGAGVRGTDNEAQVRTAKKIFENNRDLLSQTIIICPQSNEWWNLDRKAEGDQKGTLGSVLHLLDEIKNSYSCDSNRIYVTGLSMGGYATWDLLTEYGHLFAAGIPVCGGGDDSKAYKLRQIPIRIYHSKDDPTVSFSNSQRMYNAIKNVGGEKVTFIQLDGLGHNCWDYAYSDREAFCWLLAQNKEKNPTCEYEYMPYFRIANEKGQTIISEEDIESVFHSASFGEDEEITVDMRLTANGKEKLAMGYELNSTDKFTVYWSDQKIYTFTVSGAPIDDTFSIVGVFDEETAVAFCDSLEDILG